MKSIFLRGFEQGQFYTRCIRGAWQVPFQVLTLFLLDDNHADGRLLNRDNIVFILEMLLLFLLFMILDEALAPARSLDSDLFSTNQLCPELRVIFVVTEFGLQCS